MDTQGLLLAVKVHSAALVDRLGAPLLLHDLAGRFPRLSHLFADGGYTGPLLEWSKAHLGWTTEIVPKPDPWVLINGELARVCGPKGGFQVQCHRWKMERLIVSPLTFPSVLVPSALCPQGRHGH